MAGHDGSQVTSMEISLRTEMAIVTVGAGNLRTVTTEPGTPKALDESSSNTTN